MVRGYFRLPPGGSGVQEKLAALIEAGAASGNIFFDEAGTRELRRMLGMLQEGDTLLVLRIMDACRDIGEMFDLLRYLRDRGIRMQSVGEPWFNISPGVMQSRMLCELIERLYMLACRMECARSEAAQERTRPVGRPKGTKRELMVKIETAFGLYDREEELSVSEICQSVGLNERTFYRHLSNRQPLELVRRPKGRKPRQY